MFGKSAKGVPQLEELIVEAPLATSDGTVLSFRAQNQTLIAVLVRSMAYQPPPTPLKPLAKLLALLHLTPHPAFPLSAALQSVPAVVLETLL